MGLASSCEVVQVYPRCLIPGPSVNWGMLFSWQWQKHKRVKRNTWFFLRPSSELALNHFCPHFIVKASHMTKPNINGTCKCNPVTKEGRIHGKGKEGRKNCEQRIQGTSKCISKLFSFVKLSTIIPTYLIPFISIFSYHIALLILQREFDLFYILHWLRSLPYT